MCCCRGVGFFVIYISDGFWRTGYRFQNTAYFIFVSVPFISSIGTANSSSAAVFQCAGTFRGLCFTVGFSLIELDLSSWNCVVRVTNNLCTIKKKVLAESSCHRGLRAGTNRSVRRLHISSPKVRMMDLVLECVDELEVQVLSQCSAFWTRTTPPLTPRNPFPFSSSLAGD